MDAIGLEDFRPWAPTQRKSVAPVEGADPGGAYRTTAVPTRPPSSNSDEDASVKRLLRDCCLAMGGLDSKVL